VAEGLGRLPVALPPARRVWPFPGCLAFFFPLREAGRVQTLLPPFFFDFLLGGAGGARVMCFLTPFPEALIPSSSSPSAGASGGARAGVPASEASAGVASEKGVSGSAEAGVSGRLGVGVWAAEAGVSAAGGEAGWSGEESEGGCIGGSGGGGDADAAASDIGMNASGEIRWSEGLVGYDVGPVFASSLEQYNQLR
jgi:hypothetical protein